MANVGPEFNGSIFRKDWPVVIATNRSSAVLLPVAVRYNASGLVAGVALARNTTDGLYDTYASGGASGTNVPACLLFESHDAADWPAASGAIIAAGIFGGCTVYEAAISNYDATVKSTLGMREITDATGTVTLVF